MGSKSDSPPGSELEDEDLDPRVYPSIAVSDGFNSACCFYAASLALSKGRGDAACGIGMVAVASAIGTARFALGGKTLAWGNSFGADLAASFGIPLLGLGFARARHLWPDVLPTAASGSVTSLPSSLLYALGVSFVVTRLLASNKKLKELYLTASGVASLGMVLHAEKLSAEALRAVGLFLVAAVVVGNDRHRTIFGIRRENVFHYLLGPTMVLFGQALPLP